MKYRLYYRIAVLGFLFNLVVGTLYRNYIYSNNIMDLGIADIHPNIFSVIIASFIFMGYSKEESELNEIKIILAVTTGFIIYEFIQLTPLIGVFDIKDLMGTVIGGGICLLVHRIIYRRFV